MARGDLLIIDGLALWGRHGVIPEEHILGQKFIVDIEVSYDMDKICQSDDLADGLSYTTVYEIAKRVVTTEEHKLLQRLAQRIADEIKAAYPVNSVKVAVKDPSVHLGHNLINFTAVSIVR